jgi:ergothioneine biosynthesis protein EgtB
MGVGTHSRQETTDSGPLPAPLIFANAQTATETFRRIRMASETLCAGLEIEDYGVQPMPDASPPKWHLAHTTWFFDTFLLKVWDDQWQPYHPLFEHLFNSYYNGVGEPFPRWRRGHLSRPTVSQVHDYRRHVDSRVCALLGSAQDTPSWPDLVRLLELGLHHEQQHQELLLTDMKYNLGHNPLYPALTSTPQAAAVHEEGSGSQAADLGFDFYDPGLVDIGAGPGFCFDNELPRHRTFIGAYTLADRLTTNGEYLAFIEDGGYQRADLWLSEAWAELQSRSTHHPLYWRHQDGAWQEYGLNTGLQPLDLQAPVVHVSGYEAAAFAAWSQARLPTEFEWEFAAATLPIQGNFVEQGDYHPKAISGVGKQFFGDVWEWTSSSYGPYPGYRPLPGVLGEYNGKFMSSQWVLRGGSCATPTSHIRASYRNFFYPKDAWQFSGIRLARDS